MPSSIPIAYRTERRAFSLAMIELSLVLRRSIFEGREKNDAGVGTMLLVAAAVVVGHADGKPMSASKVALFVDLPRTTVMRKLHQLEELGVITRRGLVYFLSPERASNQETFVKNSTRIWLKAAEAIARNAIDARLTCPLRHGCLQGIGARPSCSMVSCPAPRDMAP
jgi:hypothetical protein